MIDQLDVLRTPIGFVEGLLGLPLYPWQDKALAPLELAVGKNAKRQNIAVITPNGAGKDTRIICGAAMYWLSVFPQGKVVITSKSDLQIKEQTIPAIEAQRVKFPGYHAVHSPRYELTTSTGGKCICFVTNKGERAEGWHKLDDFTGPLLLIINEAKGVDRPIFDSILGRCTPNAVIVASSTGGKSGTLWEIYSKHRESWTIVQAGLADCPHIPKERIQFVIDTYGPDHPHTRSTLYGEFMDQEDGDQYLVNAAALESSISFPPKHTSGPQRLAFCDFGGAQSEHTFGIRDGNKLWIQDAWIEANPEAACGRFIRNFRESGLKEDQIWCDASDKDLAELLASHGWTIWRQNFGGKPMNANYTSWGAEAWWESGLAVLKNEFILPDDEKMRAQAISRKKVITVHGKLGAEEKHDLAKRNLPSPDRWDTIAALMRCGGNAKPQKQAWSIPSDWQEQSEREVEYAGVVEAGAFFGS